jgi:hypothetical protein
VETTENSEMIRGDLYISKPKFNMDCKLDEREGYAIALSKLGVY